MNHGSILVELTLLALVHLEKPRSLNPKPSTLNPFRNLNSQTVLGLKGMESVAEGLPFANLAKNDRCGLLGSGKSLM